MAPEEAPRELGERFVASLGWWIARSRVEQRVGELLAAPRPAAHDAVELRPQHQVTKRRPGSADTGLSERRGELLSRQELPFRERPRQGPVREAEARLVEAVAAIVVGHLAPNARRRKLEHPARVVRGHEVPGRAQHVGSEQLPVLEGRLHIGVTRPRDALPEGPLGLEEVLRLDRAQSSQGQGQRTETSARQALILEAQGGDLVPG